MRFGKILKSRIIVLIVNPFGSIDAVFIRKSSLSDRALMNFMSFHK